MALDTIIFDLDGTLVDTAGDLTASLNHVLGLMGRRPVPPESVRAMVGHGARKLLERGLAATGAMTAEMVEAGVQPFLDHYAANIAVHSRPFAGVERALDRLEGQGLRLAVCTNKPERPARALLASLGLGDRFAAIGGGDSFPVRKPDPGHLLATIAAAGGTPETAVMVGDHRNDVRAAAGAGLPCIFAAWGYGPPEMAEGGPVAVTPSDLPSLAAALRG